MLTLLARFLARPAVADAIIRRAQRTPYVDITSANGIQTYMGRWWLFNRYDRPGGARFKFLPSIRVHHIMREDRDRHLHDHPWNARTFILRGWYLEQLDDKGRKVHMREAGYTGRLLFGQYHRIAAVSAFGVWTIFITWRYRGTWGFRVNGRKVPWREYLEGGQE
ncbi:hypothetical protein H0A64_07025 [Alcaligenaceae bacterium]|nr:hypothetical protein [Alcaligenaceae bacterium]